MPDIVLNNKSYEEITKISLNDFIKFCMWIFSAVHIRVISRNLKLGGIDKCLEGGGGVNLHETEI